MNGTFATMVEYYNEVSQRRKAEAEVARLTAQRDRLRKYIEFMEYEDWTPDTIAENRAFYKLQPGDMTD